MPTLGASTWRSQGAHLSARRAVSPILKGTQPKSKKTTKMRENAERAAGTAARSAKNTYPLYYFAKVDPKNDKKSEDKKNIFSYSLLVSKRILNGSWERTNFQRVPLRTADVPERGAHGGDSLSNYSRTGPIPNCILAVTWEKLPAARARRSDARARGRSSACATSSASTWPPS